MTMNDKSEIGFYHPDRGYWQTTDRPPEVILSTYPEGTVEVPLRPGFNFAWDGGAWVATPPVITSEDVNAERDRRIVEGFSFKGHLFQADAESVTNINGAVSAALAAQMSGIASNELNWFNGSQFAWLAIDNTDVQMAPAEVVAFGMAAAAHKAAHIHAARDLKDSHPIPATYSQDKHWPGA